MPIPNPILSVLSLSNHFRGLMITVECDGDDDDVRVWWRWRRLARCFRRAWSRTFTDGDAWSRRAWASGTWWSSVPLPLRGTSWSRRSFFTRSFRFGSRGVRSNSRRCLMASLRNLPSWRYASEVPVYSGLRFSYLWVVPLIQEILRTVLFASDSIQLCM